MTKVNNGKITPSGTAAIPTSHNNRGVKSINSAKAAAVLARLDEMSVSLADELSHYGDVDDDATLDLSVKEETDGGKLTTAAFAPPKKLETFLEHPKFISKKGDDEASNGEDSTIVEEVSYVLDRFNNKSFRRNDKDVAAASKPFVNVQAKISNRPHATERPSAVFAKNHVVSTSNAESAVKPSTALRHKKDSLQTLRILGSCSFDDSASDASSDGGFSIEEAEEEEVIISETTPVLPPMRSKAPFVQRGSIKAKQCIIQSYIHSLSFDESVLDDASILDLQTSKTPKIKNKKALAGKSPGSDHTSFASRSVSSGSAPSHHFSAGNRKINTAFATNTVTSMESEDETASTEKPPASTTSWGFFSRKTPSAVIAESNTASSSHPSKSSGQRSRSQLKPPSELMIDIESGSASRRGKKRNNISSSSSRVSSAISLDETEAIIRDAIIIKNQATGRRKRVLCCAASAIIMLAAIAISALMVSKKLIPGFLHKPLSNLGVISASPTSTTNATVDPKGVPNTVWYADFDLFKCVQNCTSEGKIESLTCGGNMNGWEKGFDTLEECCLENFSSFIGKDWSLRDCMMLSYPDVLSTEGGDSEETASSNAPTYMPTAGVNVQKPDEQEIANNPAAIAKTEATSQTLGGSFKAEHEATTSIVNEGTPTYMPTKDMGAEDRPSTSGTTPWAMNNAGNDSSTYVLELDENYNPINPTTGAAAVAVVTSEMPAFTSVTTSTAAIDGDHMVAITETIATTATVTSEFQSAAAAVTTAATSRTNSSSHATPYVLVYYADWDKKRCLLMGKDELQPWQKMYSTEDECCLDNFSWDVNGYCFKGAAQSSFLDLANSSIVPSSNAVSTLQPSAKPTLKPPTPKPTSKPSVKPSPKPVSANPTNHPTKTIAVYIAFNGKTCIQVSKSTLKDSVKDYESEEECCLDNNFSHCQPTQFPTMSPSEVQETKPPTSKPSEIRTTKPSRSVSNNLTVSSPASSVAVSKSGSNECTLEFCDYQISPEYLLEYRVNIPNDTSFDECSGCTISMNLIYNGETSWIGIAFSTTGEMIGSEAIIGVPGMTPAKYYLGGKYESAVQLMEQSKQTLLNPRVEVADGQTVLSFTKLLVEKNEIKIITGENIFLWAHGTDSETTSHLGNRGAFRLNLSVQPYNELVTPSPTNKPSNRLTTIKQSQHPSAKPNAVSTMTPTTSPVPASVQVNTSQNPTPISLAALLLSKSPNSTESLADKTSAQYLAMKWLSKNPDLGEITDERKVQRWVLATFYRSLHGDEWTFHDGWLDISGDVVEECMWYNILCDSSGYVVSLDLKNNYLWGSIPMEVFLLQKCEYLGLSSNYLKYIQPTIFDMKNLKVLDMDDNGIQVIPSEINTSIELEELYLSHNKITYIPDAILELTYLKALFMFDNWIASTVPSKIGQLTSLEELDLEMNYFTGQLPDELYNLSNLKKLWLFGNMITGQLSPNLSKMSSLNVLDLSQNYISGEIPTEIGLFQNMTELYLTKNLISGQLPTELSKLTSLTVLDMSMNYLNSTVISDIGALENLVTLRLDNNYRLGENASLVSSGLQGTIPSSIGNLKGLRELRLDNNFIQGPLPSELGNLQRLEILRIEANDIHGGIPNQFGNARNLQYLHLWSNYIGGTIPSTLGNLVHLKELFLDDNELTGAIPSELGGLTNVTYIALASNNLESTIPSQLGKLPSIEKLELQSNYLYGEVPKELGDLPLVLLQLEDNFLYGDIPDEVCHSNTIQYLSGSCPGTRQPSPAPDLSRTTTDSQNLALVSARNGVRAAGVGATRKRSGQRPRDLAQNTPTSSPTLEYWWSCNCCTECLSS
ncbi:hypothetical protein HJC23_002366 [Cyclotella cryptica]|uniref:Disease resistance R13L4/SHOC-2-like LRR domain-containing protein n=1 Tax=Cyclotella cryptica TaxID=29204 RepID=A0ABD3QLX4_9STRA|eukprot:CCRYP_004466-RB/>CCRYP_004466-RB protein AED:0.10 eAED:0.10 QI:224/1/1/1/0.73/0.68/16/3354/1822